ncbi:putative baseplate assembly protein [Chloroflexota bacterium]
MALQAPNLDDRKFQDIVSEARSKIPLYCPKWTDYNLSDPGITLIELFAGMVDMLLYRLNRVPEKNYIKFMELLGIQLEPPKPAMANVTFRLSVPQPEPLILPAGIEVATVQTEFQEAIVFTTNRDLNILGPTLAYAMVTPDDATFEDVLTELKNPDRVTPVFEEVPQENNALYLGYHEDLSAHTMILDVQSTIEGIGVSPHNPPRTWEYWDGDQERWLPVRLDSDTTGGLNTSGQIIFDIPVTSDMRDFNGKHACWIRCRATKPQPKQGPYHSSPKIRSVISNGIGGTVPASHASIMKNELLGRSDGTPGQKLQLLHVPVLHRESGEILEVETENEGEFEPWQEVSDFAHSEPDAPHFTCDGVSGEIQLGPVIRQPSGEERQYGKVPPVGRLFRFTSYRYGGGVVGNVGEGTITVLQSSIPYVTSVTNFEAAKGGTDAETIENAKLRAPHVIKANTRAVTAGDYEFLALEASPGVARAKCVSPGDGAPGQSPPPGIVRLLLVPAVSDINSHIPVEELELPRRVREKVQLYLDERRPLATRLEIASPEYIPVSVSVQVKAKKRSVPEQVAADVERSLYRYINPICGGADGEGWPFGRSLSLPEIYAALQGVKKVDYMEDVSIFPVDITTGERQEATARIDISSQSLICSYKHEVTVVE